MLQQIRERFTGIFAIILIGMLSISFVFFGIGNFSFFGNTPAATVDGVEIPVFQLDSEYQNRLFQLQATGDLSPEISRAVRSSVLDQLIRDTVIDVYVSKNGFYISDDQLSELILSEPQFQENGAFSRALYDQWLELQRVDSAYFEAVQRRGYRQSQLLRGIGATAFVTPGEYRRYLNLVSEERNVETALFDIAALADTLEITEEDARAYYDARPDGFMASESVDFDYILVDRQALADEAEISEEDLTTYYDDNRQRFRQDEQRRASHILILFGDDEAAAEQQATELTERARAGESFADLATEFSQDGGTSAQGGDLGTVVQSQMPGALGDAIFAMQLNDITGPVKSDFGFHVVQLNEVNDGGALPLEQVRVELLDELRSAQAEGRYIQLERELGDALFDLDSIQAIADRVGVTAQTVSGFGRGGSEPFAGNQAVIDLVFDAAAANDQQVSDFTEIDANRAVLIKTKVYHPAARRPFEDVQADITFSMQSERALETVQLQSETVQGALREGRNFASLAAEVNAAYTPARNIGRIDTTIDPRVLGAIFQSAKPAEGQAELGSVVTSTGDYVVYKINQVIPGRPEALPLAERDQRKLELQQQSGAMDYNAFVNELTRTADIERSENALEDPFLQ